MATTWVNFAEVRSKVTIEQVLLTYYGLTTLKRADGKLVGPCPVHGGTSPRAFHADLDKNLWHCFTKCQGGGNQLDLVAKKDGISVREAAIRLQTAFLGGGVTTLPPPGSSERTPPATTTRQRSTEPVTKDPAEPDPNPPLDLTLTLSQTHPHLTEERRLSAGTIGHFGVGYCAKGILRGMIAIPVHDETGTLIAYAGRRLRPSDIREFGKYKFPKGFRKDLVVYNLHRANAVDPTGPIVLVEGFFAVLTLYAAGLDVVGAIMGVELSERQAALVATHTEVILLFDGDEAGQAGAAAAKAKLAGRTTVREIRLPPGMKPDALDPKALRWLIRGVSVLNITEITFVLGESPSP